MALAVRPLDPKPFPLQLTRRVAPVPPRCLVLAEADSPWETGASRARAEFEEVHVLHEWPAEGVARFLRRALRRLGTNTFSVVTLALGQNAELLPRLNYFEQMLRQRDGNRLKLVRLVCPSSVPLPVWALDLTESLTEFAVGVELVFG
jgi:hypothetical protein